LGNAGHDVFLLCLHQHADGCDQIQLFRASSEYVIASPFQTGFLVHVELDAGKQADAIAMPKFELDQEGSDDQFRASLLVVEVQR